MSEAKKDSTLKRFFKWLFIFPIIFERLEEITKAVRDINTDLSRLEEVFKREIRTEADGTDKNINSKFDNLKGRIENILTKMDVILKTPHHYFTIYYNLKSQLFNLSNSRVGIEVDYQPEVEDKGLLLFYLKIDGKIADTFRMDLAKIDDKSPQKPTFDEGRILLRKRELKRADIEAQCLNSLYYAMKDVPTLQHYQLFNICVQSYLNAIEAELERRKEKEQPPVNPSAAVDLEPDQAIVEGEVK